VNCRPSLLLLLLLLLVLKTVAADAAAISACAVKSAVPDALPLSISRLTPVTHELSLLQHQIWRHSSMFIAQIIIEQ
jgi:hypothetical protein